MSALLALLVLTACSSPDTPPVADVSDVGVGDDVAPGEDMSPDAAPDAALDLGPSTCVFQEDCPADAEICVEGICEPSVGCDSVDDWQLCVRELTPYGEHVALRAMCGDAG